MSSLKLFLFSLEKFHLSKTLAPSLQKKKKTRENQKNPVKPKMDSETSTKLQISPCFVFHFYRLWKGICCSAFKDLSWKREEFWGAGCWLCLLSFEMSLTSMTCTLQMKWELEGYIPKLKGQCSVEWQNSGAFCVE